ncbi:hypothetical protein ACOSQ2_028772 [Xanthoceras sorbifolium]
MTEKIKICLRRLQNAGGLDNTKMTISQYISNATRIGQPPVGALSLALTSFVNRLTDATTIKGPSGHDDLLQMLLGEIKSFRTKVTELNTEVIGLKDVVVKVSNKVNKGKQRAEDIGPIADYAIPHSTLKSADIGC